MATYYVSSSGTNDSDLGASDSPFQTIQFGVNQLAAGDTLLVEDGTYVEEINITVAATSGSPVAVRAVNIHGAIIDGEAGVLGTNHGLPACSSSCLDTDLVKVSTVTDRGYVFDGLVDITGDFITFDGFEIKRSMGRGLRVFSAADNITVKNTKINFSRHGGFLSDTTPTNILVDGCEIYRNGDFAPYTRSVPGWAIQVQLRGKSMTVQNCLIYENWGEGIGPGRDSSTIVIQDNIIYDNFAWQIYGDHCRNVVIQRNLVYFSTSTEMERSNAPSAGITINNETDSTTNISEDISILNNYVRGCRNNIGLASQ